MYVLCALAFDYDLRAIIDSIKTHTHSPTSCTPSTWPLGVLRRAMGCISVCELTHNDCPRNRYVRCNSSYPVPNQEAHIFSDPVTACLIGFKALYGEFAVRFPKISTSGGSIGSRATLLMRSSLLKTLYRDGMSSLLSSKFCP